MAAIFIIILHTILAAGIVLAWPKP